MADVPAKTVQANALTAPSTSRPEAEVQHRKWLGGAVKTLLGHYWQDADRAFELEAAVLRDWMDDLGNFPQEIVAGAISEWRRNNARRPTPADIIRLCRQRMPRPRVVSEPEPQRERVSPEAAREILAATGWDRRIVKTMPKESAE